MKRLLILVIILAAFFFLLPSRTNPVSAACTFNKIAATCVGTCANCGTCTDGASFGTCACTNVPAAYCDPGKYCACGCNKTSCGGTCKSCCSPNIGCSQCCNPTTGGGSCYNRTGPPAGCGSCGGYADCGGGSCYSPSEPYCNKTCSYGCTNSCSGGSCNPAPAPTPTQCSCDPPTWDWYTTNVCQKRSDCGTPGACFAVCNYSLSPCGWACTSEDPTCTTDCNNANSWSSWYCNIDGTETKYCTLSGCTQVAKARTPCQGNGGGPTPTQPPSCTPDCSGSGSYCNGASYYAPNCGSCTGTKAQNCSGSGTVCSGTTYPDPNGCGTCTGTKAQNCSGSGTVCSGTTYPDPNGCGTCTGTRGLDCSGAGSVCSGTTYPDPNGCGNCTGTKDCTVTIRARAMKVSIADTSCTAVRASITGVTSTVHQFTPSSASQPAQQTQIGTTYAVFSSLISGLYTINSQAPSQYILARVCWTDSLSGTSGEGFSQTLPPTDTVTWDLGYTLGVAWSQAQGGDVYASGTLKSYVASLTSPRAFILDGTTGGYPGVATYGQSYNFDSSGTTKGQTWVSSKNWLVNDTAPNTDFYQLMYRQFGGAPATVDYVNPSPLPQPLYKPDPNNPDIYIPYYVTGNMTTSGDWSIGDGKKLIFIVNGNLTINGKINLVGSGFAAFIVNGNITVVPTVAGSPAVEGVYITSPAGTFSTGAGAQRFVGRGMFVAGSFLLQRDLGEAGNPTTSSELFIYNPQLLLTMPEAMKKLSVSWQEVAP